MAWLPRAPPTWGRPAPVRTPRGCSSASRDATPRVTTQPRWCTGSESAGTRCRPRARAEQILGLLLGSRRDLEDAIVYALERGFDLLVLDGTGALGGEWPELRAAPDLALVHDTIATLRRLKKEEMIDIAWFGGARSGTDAAKLVGLRHRHPARVDTGRVARKLHHSAAADAPTAMNLLSQIPAAALLRG